MNFTKRMGFWFFTGTLVVLTGILFLRRRSSIDRTTVEIADRQELLGLWYELARFDHPFERGLQEVEARYTLLDDGTLKVENSGFDPAVGARRTAVGHAKFTPDSGRLRVSFFWKFYSDYNILERGARGEWMLVGSRSPRYLWILARTDSLPVGEMEHILDRAREHGYDTSGLILRN